MLRVAVLGGGISGLAAAHHLTRSGEVDVRLFEAAGRVGGVLETLQAGDYLIERSADNFATLIPDALQLSHECGLEHELVRPNEVGRQAFVWHRGRSVPIPAGFSLMQPTRIASILSTPALSWAGKLRVLGEYWVPKREVNSDDDDESLESFAVRRLGREAFENLVEPIVSGIFTANPKTLSMRATMPQFVEMERRCGGLIRGYLASKKQDAAAAARRASGARYDQFMAPRDGMSHWIESIAATLPSETIQLGRPVIQLRPQTTLGRATWQVVSQAADGSSPTEEFDGIVCALPAAATARLLHDWSDATAKLIAGIEYASSVVYAAVVNRRDITARLDGFGLIVPGKYARQTMAVSFTSNKYPGRVPDDEVLLRVFLGGALRPEVIDHDDAKIESLALGELRQLMGWRGTVPNWSSIIRWREAMPQYTLGHVSRWRQIRSQLTPYAIQLCGAAYEGVGIPQCVRGGRHAADAVLSQLRSDR